MARPELVITFHEDNETAIVAMRQGWSSAMRHLERTHGVCLRSLAENMRKPHFDLIYERSALQSADIYTKAFGDASEWTRVQRLINHLNPTLVCSGQVSCKAMPFSEEHKGGIHYSYWTSCPWLSQANGATDSTKHAASAMQSSRSPQSTTCSTQSPDDLEHGYFDDSSLYDPAEYAESAPSDDEHEHDDESH